MILASIRPPRHNIAKNDRIKNGAHIYVTIIAHQSTCFIATPIFNIVENDILLFILTALSANLAAYDVIIAELLNNVNLFSVLFGQIIIVEFRMRSFIL